MVINITMAHAGWAGAVLLVRRNAYGYASIDVRVAQRIGYGFRSFFLGENLLDAGDAEFLAMAPRTFSGGLEYEY